MTKKKKLISIGVICFNEEENVYLTFQELGKIAQKKKKKYDFEFVFVDNGSTDNTRGEIRKISKLDKRIKGIFLSRNFGPESSSQASLDFSKGDAFVLYEGDMQDPPEVILKFIESWEKGFKVIVGVRDKTEDSFFMTIIRKSYYRIFQATSNIEVPVNAGSFGLLDKSVMEAVRKMPEKYRFFRGLRAWVGFKTAFVKYQRRKRQRGNSSYTFLRYIQHAERSFFGFSYLPLDIIVYIGLISVILSFFSIVAYLLSLVLLHQTISGMMVILLLIILFGGIQVLALSIIGKYIQVIVEETKNRPPYIIEETI